MLSFLLLGILVIAQPDLNRHPGMLLPIPLLFAKEAHIFLIKSIPRQDINRRVRPGNGTLHRRLFIRRPE